MDSGEIEIANQEASSNVNDGDQGAGSCSMESFFDEILKDSHACTHAHSCNPPGPDASHTHTCFHVHTKIITNPAIDADSEEKTTNRKRPLGNREAVRKYREKMKARAASLEDEVAQLREINEQLLRRLQSQASLEAEVMRLKCLLVDIRGRIEGEIGSFPYQKTVASAPVQVSLPIGTHVLDPCDMRFNDQVYCMRHGALEKSEMRHGGCDGAAVQCSADSSSGSEFLNSARASVLPKTSDSNGNRSRAKLRNARDF
ncbi:basic leucine zipper 19-like isoform X1 [Wolffia australiana]